MTSKLKGLSSSRLAPTEQYKWRPNLNLLSLLSHAQVDTIHQIHFRTQTSVQSLELKSIPNQRHYDHN